MPIIGRTDGSSKALHSLSQTLSRLADIQGQLASGQRINRAADGPAALVAVERLGAETRELSRSIESAQRGVNLFQAAEAGIAQAGDLLVRARDLAVQAADGTLGSEERSLLQEQLDGTLQALARVGNTTRFAGDNLLSGARDFSLAGVGSEFQAVQIRQARLPEDGGALNVSVQVSAAAAAAQAQGTIADTLFCGSVRTPFGPLHVSAQRNSVVGVALLS